MFVDFEPIKMPCQHPEHNPPGNIVLPAGRHTWECPACGQRTVVSSPVVVCESGAVGFEARQGFHNTGTSVGWHCEIMRQARIKEASETYPVSWLDDATVFGPEPVPETEQGHE